MAKMPQPPATVCWHKSTWTGSGACVEVARAHDLVWIRDSKNRTRPVLGFTRAGWAAFVLGVRRDEFGQA